MTENSASLEFNFHYVHLLELNVTLEQTNSYAELLID